jgi:hypothetical protein
MKPGEGDIEYPKESQNISMDFGEVVKIRKFNTIATATSDCESYN